MAHSLSTIQNCCNAKMLRPFMFGYLVKIRFFIALLNQKKTDTVAWKPEQLKQNLCHYGNLTRISSLRGLDAPVTARRFPVFLATIGGFSDAR